MAFEAYDLARVIGEKADRADAEVVEDLGSDAVVPEIHGPFRVGLGAERVLFGPHVKKDSGAFGADALEGGVDEAVGRSEEVLEQGGAMDADEGRPAGQRVAEDQGEVFALVEKTGVDPELEFAEIGGYAALRAQLDEFFAEPAMVDEVGDGANAESVGKGEAFEVGHAGHGPIGIEDFANDRSGFEAGEADEIDSRFGVSGATQHAPALGDEREDMAGLDEIFGAGSGIGEYADCGGAIGGADPGGDAASRVDGHGEMGGERFPVFADHSGKAETFGRLGGDWSADETAGMSGHEIDHGRGNAGRGGDEIAFVFALAIVGNNDEGSIGEFAGGVFDGSHDAGGGADGGLAHAARVMFCDGAAFATGDCRGNREGRGAGGRRGAAGCESAGGRGGL